MDHPRDHIIEIARRQYSMDSDDDIAIDDDARMSLVDGGIWVSAWVWVSRDNLKEE